jgi:hypothetical protein
MPQRPASGGRRPRRRRLGSSTRLFRLGVVVLVALGGGSAGAAVIVRNYMATEIVREEPCLSIRPGSDALAFPGGFPSIGLSSDTTTSSSGVPLLRQVITVRSARPTRTVLGDVIRIRNRCGTAMTVVLSATPHGATPAVGGVWTDFAMRAYLSAATTAVPTLDADPPLPPAASVSRDASFTDPSVVALWDQSPIRVAPVVGGPGTLLNASTGVVNLPPNSDAQIGVIADGGSSSTAVDAVLRLTITGTAQ